VKGLGCQVALDHFGVGFFSLSHLKRLPVDYLKIDEHLIRDLQGDRVDRHVVEAIVEVSHALGPRTVGEGVGDGDTMELLRECGVDYAEGPHVGKPRPVAELWAAT
jgi:EAL domain-containing protein (putative c-di-GMP-specific phosphodiesterase class I)